MSALKVVTYVETCDGFLGKKGLSSILPTSFLRSKA